MQLKDRKTQIETALIMYSECAVSFEIVRSVPDLAAEQSPQLRVIIENHFLTLWCRQLKDLEHQLLIYIQLLILMIICLIPEWAVTSFPEC